MPRTPKIFAPIVPASQSHLEPPEAKSRRLMSDAERADRGRAQIAAGNFVEVEDVDAYFYSLQVPVEV
jgi:hypothetical protein